MLDWKSLLEPYKKPLLEDLDGLLRIPSVKNVETVSDQAPFGQGIADALQYMLDLGERDGFTSKNIQGYAGRVSLGQGTESLAILGHLDVVPADPNQWETNPFVPEIKDDKLIARGALDDKGPTLMAYYAVKILNDIGVTWNKEIQLIYGTDEENDWEGVRYYFEHEAMPDYGIVPDGIFPMIYAEKGVAQIDLTGHFDTKVLQSFQSGQTYNQVPDLATATINNQQVVTTDFEAYLTQHHLIGKLTNDGNQQTLTLIGKAAHGSSPQSGLNAATYLADFLSKQKLDKVSHQLLTFIKDKLHDNQDGKKFDLDFQDEELGATTLNPAIFSFVNGLLRIGIDFRYPAGFEFSKALAHLQATAKDFDLSAQLISLKEPSHTDLNHPYTKKLLAIYRKHTGDKTPALAIGGITYGRVFKQGVTFGPAFLGKKATLHQPNEYIELEDLFKALEIYLDALYQLATEEGKS